MDIEQRQELLRYLRSGGWIGPEEEPEVYPLSGGVSNRTVWVERLNGEAWVLKQALEKLRVAGDWYSDPERIHREALGIRWLGKLTPPGTITPLVFEDHVYHILAMQAVPQPHVNWKTMLLAGKLELDHVTQFGALLGIIHRESSLRRFEIEPFFIDRSFFESLRIEPYYAYTVSQVPAAGSFYSTLIADYQSRAISLVHGDYSPKNLLLYAGRLVLLDHEVIHFGDPAFDLGFSLTHLLSKAHHLPQHRVAFGQAAIYYWRVYMQTLGKTGWEMNLEPRVVQHTLGCLLARAVGRSPLEYLNPEERSRQAAVTLKLMNQPIQRVEELVKGFLYELEY